MSSLPAAGPHLRVGTRGSTLALAQSGRVAAALRRLGATVELVTIRTAGDNRAPSTVWGEGAFVTALEQALADGWIDVAVHSAKDVPTTLDPRLVIAAFPVREDPRDALVATDPALTLATLPRGARIGTDSPRRVAFLLAHRPDLRPHPLHGNVDTRLRRLADGNSDALILAAAGLTRLGLRDRITELVSPDVLPPAPGQGALAVQCRTDDAVTRSVAQRLDDPATRVAVEAERAVLAAAGGGCRSPLGALGTVRDGVLELLVGSADPADVRVGDAPAADVAAAPGTTFTAVDQAPGPVRVAWARGTAAVAEAPALAIALAAQVTATIARHGTGRPVPGVTGLRLPGDPADGSASGAGHAGRRVLVTRDRERAGDLCAELRARDLEPVRVPTIEVRAADPGGPLDEVVASLAAYSWTVLTSAAGADSLAAAVARQGSDLARARIASVGTATSAAVARAGGRADFEPAVTTARGLADELPVDAGARVLLVRGDLADGALRDRLRERGAAVDEVVAYQTIEAPAASARPLQAAVRAGLDALVLTSGSTVRGLLALLAADERPAVLRLPAFCIGPTTAEVARAAGFSFVREAEAPDPRALAELVRSGLAAAADRHLPATAAGETP